jgi:hypothetical protein
VQPPQTWKVDEAFHVGRPVGIQVEPGIGTLLQACREVPIARLAEVLGDAEGVLVRLERRRGQCCRVAVDDPVVAHIR